MKSEEMSSMQTDEVYREEVPFHLGKFALVMLALFTILMLFLFIYQLVVGPVGSRPGPSWVYLVMFFFLGVITVLVGNFNKLAIIITSQAIIVGFGRMKKSITWGDIEGCDIDKTSGLGYGGWGIRIARAHGKWRLVYNVTGYYGILLALRTGRFREFVFSTADPEEVMKIIRKHCGRVS